VFKVTEQAVRNIDHRCRDITGREPAADFNSGGRVNMPLQQLLLRRLAGEKLLQRQSTVTDRTGHANSVTNFSAVSTDPGGLCGNSISSN